LPAGPSSGGEWALDRVWAMSGRDYFWPVWPTLGYALFLGWQAFNVLGPQTPDRARRRDRDR